MSAVCGMSELCSKLQASQFICKSLGFFLNFNKDIEVHYTVLKRFLSRLFLIKSYIFENWHTEPQSSGVKKNSLNYS